MYEPKYNPEDYYWYVYDTLLNEYTDIKHRKEEVIERYALEMNCWEDN